MSTGDQIHRCQKIIFETAVHAFAVPNSSAHTRLELAGTQRDIFGTGPNLESDSVGGATALLISQKRGTMHMTEIDFDGFEAESFRQWIAIPQPGKRKKLRLCFDFHKNGSVSAPGEVIIKCIKSGMLGLTVPSLDPRFQHVLPAARLRLSDFEAGKHYMLDRVERVTLH